MLRIFCIFIFTLQIMSCNSQSVIVPFQCNDKGQLCVTIHINKKPVTGIFDTGAQISSIRLNDSEEAGISLSNKSINALYPAITQDTCLSKVYNSTHIEIGGINTIKAIDFINTPEIVNQTIIGFDIINQFCWLFDFKTMRLTLSNDPLNFNKDSCIILPYTIDDYNMICTINIGNRVQLNKVKSNSYIILDRISIDTGAHNTAVVHGDTISNILTISNEISLGRFTYNDINIEELVIIPQNKKYNMLSQTANSNIPYFSGYINISKQYQWYRKFNFDGILTLGEKSNYSQIYFDTKSQIIYLKK